MTRIAIFADVQNIYYTTRQAFGRPFNYRSFWERVSAAGEIVAATAYAIDRGDNKQRKFQDALRNIGFDVKLKPYIQRRDGSAKGDWDVGIAIDVMEAAREGQVAFVARVRVQVRQHLVHAAVLAEEDRLHLLDRRHRQVLYCRTHALAVGA
mgnify:CR=1 FL=1